MFLATHGVVAAYGEDIRGFVTKDQLRITLTNDAYIPEWNNPENREITDPDYYTVISKLYTAIVHTPDGKLMRADVARFEGDIIDPGEIRDHLWKSLTYFCRDNNVSMDELTQDDDGTSVTGLD